MKKKPWWLPSIGVVNLLGSTGIMLTLYSIPMGIMMAYNFHHDAHADLKAATIGGAVMTLVMIIIGCLSYRLCMSFTRKHLELAKD